jgi:hypothetical protein
VESSVFLDFNLPNATTWFYFSAMLAVALFFKFTRLLSMRNLDVLLLFLLVPGLLIVNEGRAAVARATAEKMPTDGPAGWLWFGYFWLLVGSGLFLLRCLIDLALVRRPALSPNLNLAGMAWLAVALFVCLVAVAVRRPPEAQEKVGKEPVVLTEGQRIAAERLANYMPAGRDARFWVGRVLAVACHLAVVVALVMIGAAHFHDVYAGMAAATFYLMLPYTAVHMGQVHHVWPAAMLLWAVYAYKQPAVAGLLIGLAAGSVFFPLLVLPVWLSFYWKKGASRFLAWFGGAAGLSLALAGLVLWLDGQFAHALQLTFTVADWQPWRAARAEGFWTGVHWAYRLPVFIVYGAFVLTTLFWPAPKNLAHLIALSAACLIGCQFWYADQGGVYVLWYLPLVLLLVFRPNLADRFAPPYEAKPGWFRRKTREAAAAVQQVVAVPQRLAGAR